MRDITQLHPRLQPLAIELQKQCKKEGILIGISECLRTVAEQDALYAKGRTAPGNKVTNCRGVSFSSMHQWGVAFDVYLKMDVDKDGQTSDDAYNNTTKLFNRVGAIGKKLGLEWGGDWKSPVDLPHFQLPDWGSTAKKLKEQYGTPDKFMDTWKTDNKPTTPKKEAQVSIVNGCKNPYEPAKSKNEDYTRKHVTTANLNLRTGPGTNRNIIVTIPKGSEVYCYGFYTKNSKGTWLLVQYGKYTGYVSKSYLR